MRKTLEFVSMLLGFALVGLLGWVAWESATFFVAALKTADSEVTAAIVGGVATVLVGLGAALYTQNQIKLREAEEAHRPKKIEIYNGFMNLAQRMLAAANENVRGKPVAEEELLSFMVDFKRDIVLWSSPGVINAFTEFMRQSSADSASNEVLPAVDRLYREMRKDIGLSNRGLPANQLIKVNLTDPEKLDKR